MTEWGNKLYSGEGWWQEEEEEAGSPVTFRREWGIEAVRSRRRHHRRVLQGRPWSARPAGTCRREEAAEKERIFSFKYSIYSVVREEEAGFWHPGPLAGILVYPSGFFGG